jgi:AAA domain
MRHSTKKPKQGTAEIHKSSTRKAKLHESLTPDPASDQAAPSDTNLEQPTADELFGWARPDPEPAPISPDSIAWDLAEREAARLIAEAIRNESSPVLKARGHPGVEVEPDDGFPPFAGFYSSLQELHSKQTVPADYVLTGVRRRQVTLFLSVTNVGKTTILLNHCLAAAAAQKWNPLLPDAPSRPLKVLYFDGESTDDELKQDTLTMLRSIDGEREALINFIPIVEATINGESLDLANRDHFAFVKQFVRAQKPDIVVIDTIGSLFTLFNENDNAEVKLRVIRPLKELAAAGNCAVIGSHHIGKRGENTSDEEEAYLGRGASAFGSDTRAVFTLKREKALGDGYVRLTLGKAKGVKFDPVNLKLDFQARTFEICAAMPKVESPYQKIVGAFNGHPLSLAEVETLLPELSKSTIQRSLKSAVNAGDLIKAAHGKYQKPHMVNMVTPYRDDHVDHVREVFTQKEDRDHWPEWGKNGRDHIEDSYLDAIDR